MPLMPVFLNYNTNTIICGTIVGLLLVSVDFTYMYQFVENTSGIIKF